MMKNNKTYEKLKKEEDELIEKIKKMEKELKLKQREKLSSLTDDINLKVEFEEIHEFYYEIPKLKYKIYLIRNDIKEYMCEIKNYMFIDIKRRVYSKESLEKYIIDYIFYKIEDKTAEKERSFILKKVLDNFDVFVARDIEFNEEKRKHMEKDNEVNSEYTDMMNEIIIAGYKALSKKYHPDMNTGNEDKFKQLVEAKDILLKKINQKDRGRH